MTLVEEEKSKMVVSEVKNCSQYTAIRVLEYLGSISQLGNSRNLTSPMFVLKSNSNRTKLHWTDPENVIDVKVLVFEFHCWSIP